jgi:hypothetical protein
MLAEQAPPTPSIPLPWYQVWLKALTSPNVATYQDLVSRPGVTLGKACLWVGVGLLATVVATAISVVLFLAFSSLSLLDPAAQEGIDALSALGGSAVLIACLVPFAAVAAILGLLISAGISHLLARALGGTGTYEQLAYAIAAYSAPGSIVSSAISFIPCVGAVVGFALSFYLLFLNVLAIKAVHNISWGRAVISSVLFLAIVLALVACGVIVFLALMGPAIGNVFSGIVGEI